jgi:hypothetical protein
VISEKGLDEVMKIAGGREVFACTECQRYYVLPVKCNHYQAEKIAELEACLKEADRSVRYCQRLMSHHLTITNERNIGSIRDAENNALKYLSSVEREKFKELLRGPIDEQI